MKQAMVTWVKMAAAGADSEAVAIRTQLHIPAVAVSQVTPVTDNKICNNVAKAYSAALGTPVTTYRVMYVVKVGNAYVALDPAAKTGEFGTGMVLSQQYNVLAKFTS